MTDPTHGRSYNVHGCPSSHKSVCLPPGRREKSRSFRLVKLKTAMLQEGEEGGGEERERFGCPDLHGKGAEIQAALRGL